MSDSYLEVQTRANGQPELVHVDENGRTKAQLVWTETALYMITDPTEIEGIGPHKVIEGQLLDDWLHGDTTYGPPKG